VLEGGGTTVIDTRSPATFANGFLPGTINIPRGRSFVTWAGSLISPDRDVVLLVEGEEQARALSRELSLIGIHRLVGWVAADIIEAWRSAGRRVDKARVVDVQGLADLDDAEVIDVRAASEWDAGHIPGARHIFLEHLLDATDELPRDRPLVVTCQGGSRSSIGASLLRAHGFTNVINFTGGFAEWRSAGFPVETSEGSAASR
jgi:hydroxyacylglutathione hydrolase